MFFWLCLHAQLQSYIPLNQTGLIVLGRGREGGIKIKEALLANELGDIVLIFS
jgi:hypothetical protein